jgi:hypothetical protein
VVRIQQGRKKWVKSGCERDVGTTHPENELIETKGKRER